MQGFDEREKAFENEFKYREQRAFRATVHRNRSFGLWAATRMGLETGDASETYAKSVVAADFEIPGDEDVIARVRTDLAEKGVPSTDAELRTALARAGVDARRRAEG